MEYKKRRKKLMDGVHWKVLFYVGLGILAGLVLNNTISGFANPILGAAKISVSLAG